MSDLLWSYTSLWSRKTLVVNEPFCETVADRKLLQLATAAECGLRIPETLVTNQHEEAREFISTLELQGRRTIYKQLLSGSIPVGHYTMTVTPEDQERLQEIRSAPLTLQERIEGGIDVRVVVVGDAHFAMAQRVDKNRADSNVSDVRVECRPESWCVELPADVKAGLDKLTARLRLSFGAYDFITDRAGNWFFLEVNPTGQWLFVEAAIDAPIAEALARLLWFGTVHQDKLDGLVYREEDFPGLLEEFVDREAIIQRALESQQRADAMAALG